LNAKEFLGALIVLIAFGNGSLKRSSPENLLLPVVQDVVVKVLANEKVDNSTTRIFERENFLLEIILFLFLCLQTNLHSFTLEYESTDENAQLESMYNENTSNLKQIREKISMAGKYYLYTSL